MSIAYRLDLYELEISRFSFFIEWNGCLTHSRRFSFLGKISETSTSLKSLLQLHALSHLFIIFQRLFIARFFISSHNELQQNSQIFPPYSYLFYVIHKSTRYLELHRSYVVRRNWYRSKRFGWWFSSECVFTLKAPMKKSLWMRWIQTVGTK